MSSTAPLPNPVEVDRLRELTSIGAGHAATALARLVGATIRMRVPSAGAISGEAPARNGTATDWPIGVFVEVRGGVGGIAGMLLSDAGRDHVIGKLLGGRREQASAVDVESVLREVGNVLLSSLVSAIADTLGVAVLPSTPQLASSDADSLFRSVVGQRRVALAGLRIESELVDDAGAPCALLVWAPDRASAAVRA
jgi:chemotaxis protein CheC